MILLDTFFTISAKFQLAMLTISFNKIIFFIKKCLKTGFLSVGILYWPNQAGCPLKIVHELTGHYCEDPHKISDLQK